MIIEMQEGRRNVLGRLGENEARIARFLIRPILYEFPDVSFTLLNRRKGDADAYPVNGQYIQTSGNYLLWTIQSADLSAVGDGECELIAIDGTTVVKDVIFQTEVLRALDGSGTPPEPWESWQEQVAEDAAKAEAAVEHYPKIENGFWYVWDAENEEWADTGVKAEGVDGYTPVKGVDYFDGQDGYTPVKGVDYFDGQDGHSPEVTAEKTGKKTTLSIDGTPAAEIYDGEDGDPGHTPVLTSSKSGKTTTIFADGTQLAQIQDGEDGQAADIIDDQAGSGDTGKVWSADKTSGEVSSIKNAINSIDESIAPVESTATATAAHAVGELFMFGETLMVALSAIAVGDTITTEGVTPNAAATTLSAKMIKDVQVNGSSVLNNGVANVPVATGSVFGAVKAASGNGVFAESGTLYISKSPIEYIKAGTNSYRPIVPYNQHEATFYGLAKAASADMASLSSVTVGQYPEAQKIAIQKMLGIYEAPWELIREDTVTNATEEDIIITVDGNGNPLELTDLFLLFETPTQTTYASKGTYGQIHFYYGNGTSDHMDTESNAYTQEADSVGHGIFCKLIQHGNIVDLSATTNVTKSNDANIRYRYGTAFSGTPQTIKMFDSKAIFNKINIKTVTGTAHYIIYGKRKWWT